MNIVKHKVFSVGDESQAVVHGKTFAFIFTVIIESVFFVDRRAVYIANLSDAVVLFENVKFVSFAINLFCVFAYAVGRVVVNGVELPVYS